MLDLKQRCDPDGKLLPPQALEAGEIVRIVKGPFADFVGTVERLAPDRRIWILLDMLGQNTRVALSPRDLRLAEQ